jgi:hypothetical protein
MASGEVSGRGGNLSLGGTAVSTLREWRVSQTAANKQSVSSASAGATTSTKGNIDWTGTANLYDRAAPLGGSVILPGTGYAMVGNNGSTSAAGNIVVTGLTVDVDIAGGGIITESIEFGGNGALTYGTTSVSADATAPREFTAIGCKLMFQPFTAGSAGSDAEILLVQRYSFSLKADVKVYANSGTAGVMKRLAGSAIKSASGTFTIQEGDLDLFRTKPYLPGTLGVLKCYVSSSQYWTFSQVIIDANNDVGAQIESGDLSSITVPWTWSAFNNVSGTRTQGTVTYPSGTDGSPASTAWYP